MSAQPDWAAYIAQMEQILALELDDTRRAELTQFNRIAAGAAADGAAAGRSPGSSGSISSMTLAALSISQLQQALAQGDLSARDIAQQTLAAIEQHNPAINAGPPSPRSACCGKPIGWISSVSAASRRRRWLAFPMR